MKAMIPNRAFSLVELVIAMGIGMLVALCAYTAFRTAAQSISVVNRLALENELMRTGIDQALEDGDFWTNYDDPDQPSAQPLRMSVVRDTVYGPQVRENGAFAPFNQIPIQRDWSASTTWETRPADPLLPSVADLRDPTQVRVRDLDRGWDATRPYNAADPRGWFRGNLAEEGRSDKRAGRYAMLSNKRRYPVLGFGPDPREVGGWSRDVRLGAQVQTGPFGTISSNDAEPFTWRDQQVVFLHQALGYYGMMDYLPSNATYASYGTYIIGQEPDPGTYYSNGWPAAYSPELVMVGPPASTGLWIRNDEKLDFRFVNYPQNNVKIDPAAPFPYFTPYTDTLRAPRGGGHANNRLADGAKVSLYASEVTYPLLVRTQYTGLFNTSIANDTSSNNSGYLSTVFWNLRPELTGFYNYYDNSTTENSSIPPDKWMELQRYPWPGERSQPFELSQLWQRVTMVRPVARQRPQSWPELHVADARILFRSRFMHLASVRWTDNQTGDIAELRFSTLGTSLRGARQQRKPNGGWAAWYGPAAPMNDPTLDSP